jgi:hypothetical protein
MSFIFCSVFIAVGGNQKYTLLQADYIGCSGLKTAIKQVFDPSDFWVIAWCNVRLVSQIVLAACGCCTVTIKTAYNITRQETSRDHHP